MLSNAVKMTGLAEASFVVPVALPWEDQLVCALWLNPPAIPHECYRKADALFQLTDEALNPVSGAGKALMSGPGLAALAGCPYGCYWDHYTIVVIDWDDGLPAGSSLAQVINHYTLSNQGHASCKPDDGHARAVNLGEAITEEHINGSASSGSSTSSSSSSSGGTTTSSNSSCDDLDSSPDDSSANDHSSDDSSTDDSSSDGSSATDSSTADSSTEAADDSDDAADVKVQPAATISVSPNIAKHQAEAAARQKLKEAIEAAGGVYRPEDWGVYVTMQQDGYRKLSYWLKGCADHKGLKFGGRPSAVKALLQLQQQHQDAAGHQANRQQRQPAPACIQATRPVKVQAKPPTASGKLKYLTRQQAEEVSRQKLKEAIEEAGGVYRPEDWKVYASMRRHGSYELRYILRTRNGVKRYDGRPSAVKALLQQQQQQQGMAGESPHEMLTCPQVQDAV